MSILANLLQPNSPEKLSAAVHSELIKLQAEWNKWVPDGISVEFNPDLFSSHNLNSIRQELYDPEANYSIYVSKDSLQQFSLYFLAAKFGQLEQSAHVRLESSPTALDIRFFADVGAIDLEDEAEDGATVDYSLVSTKDIPNPHTTALNMIAAARENIIKYTR